MKGSSRLRGAATFSELVHRQLNMYAIAAGAAGVSVLALGQPVEAKIVYTKANVRIGPNQHYNLDLNHDGITDFIINNTHETGTYWWCQRGNRKYKRIAASLNVTPGKDGGVEGGNLADALTKGMHIGASQQFYSLLAAMAGHVYGVNGACKSINDSFGNWVNVTNRYLGLRFISHGRTRYGWARLSVRIVDGTGVVGTLTGYAYETIPNQMIKAGQTKGAADDPTSDMDFVNPDDAGLGVPPTNLIPRAPQPASLGMLALGAQGVPLWRRKEPTGDTR